MHRPAPLVYLPKARNTGPELLWPHPESRRGFNLAFESQFRSRLETDGHVRLANGAEPTGQGLPELCGDERIAHSGRCAKPDARGCNRTSKKTPRCAPSAFGARVLGRMREKATVKRGCPGY